MVGQIVEGMPWLGTFHSIGVKILRRHAELVGLKPDFTILDVDDQIRLLKQLLEAENIDEKRWPARVLAGLIDSWKNRGLTPDQVPAGEAASFAGGKGKKLYAAYQERLKVLNAADFGDLLLECIRLFREQPEVLRQYQGAVPLHSGGRVSGHQRGAVSLAAAAGAEHAAQSPSSPPQSVSRLRDLEVRNVGQASSRAIRSPREGWRRARAFRSPVTTSSATRRAHAQEHLLRRRRRPVDLRLARRRGRQHPALRARLSRRQDHPPRAQLPLHRPHPRRRLAPDRPQRGPARQDAAHRGRAGREGAGHLVLGFGGRGARDRRGDRAAAAQRRRRATRTRSTRSPSWCAPRSRCASSRTASSRSACPIA